MNKERKILSKEMYEMVKKFEQSGLHQRDFAAFHGVGLSKLKYWIKKHKQVPKAIFENVNSTFLPVEVDQPQISTLSMALIRLPNEITIEVAISSIDAGFIHALKAC